MTRNIRSKLLTDLPANLGSSRAHCTRKRSGYNRNPASPYRKIPAIVSIFRADTYSETGTIPV